MVTLRPQRLADANFAGALGNRHQHDVHDADAAHQQRYTDDPAQHQGHHGDDRVERFHHLLRSFDLEVVGLAGFKLVGPAQQRCQAPLHSFELLKVVDSKADTDVELGIGAGNRPTDRKRYQDVIVARDAQRFTAFLAHADNLEPFAVDFDELPERVARQLQVFQHLATNKAYPAARCIVASRKKATLGRHYLVGMLKSGGNGAHPGHRGLPCVPHIGPKWAKRPELRRHMADVVNVRDNGFVVFQAKHIFLALQRLFKRGVGIDGQAVGAHALKLGADRGRQALHHRDDSNHRGHPDDDPKRGQKAAEAVGANALQRRAERLDDAKHWPPRANGPG